MFHGERLAEARVGAGLTQGELGKLVGVGHDRVSQWELGAAQPQARFVARLANVLDVSALDLMGAGAEDTGPDLEQLRKAAGLSLMDIAGAAGMSFSRYRRLERGFRVSDPPARMVFDLAAVLGIDVVDVVDAVEVTQRRRVGPGR